jgi:hypothetical protein
LNEDDNIVIPKVKLAYYFCFINCYLIFLNKKNSQKFLEFIKKVTNNKVFISDLQNAHLDIKKIDFATKIFISHLIKNENGALENVLCFQSNGKRSNIIFDKNKIFKYIHFIDYNFQ